MSRKTYAFALLALLAVVVAGCGGGGNSTNSYGGESASSESTGGESASKETGGGQSAYGGGTGGAYGNRYGGGGGSTAAGSEGSGGGAAVVSLGNAAKLGMVLVDSNGMTLYDFHKDKGTTSSCYGACAQSWPPLTTAGKPQAGNGASASKLGTTERKDGTMQVTYAGHPLYTFVGDQGPGEANGNDVKAFGASWYALKGSGEDASG